MLKELPNMKLYQTKKSFWLSICFTKSTFQFYHPQSRKKELWWRLMFVVNNMKWNILLMERVEWSLRDQLKQSIMQMFDLHQEEKNLYMERRLCGIWRRFLNDACDDLLPYYMKHCTVKNRQVGRILNML